MTRLRRLVCIGMLAMVAMATGAGAASAATFYVNGSTGNNSNPCTSPGAPCLTINEAVTKARLIPDTATIDVAAGTYTEDLLLTQAGDSGLTIDGAGSGASGGTIIQGVNTNPTIVATEPNEGPMTIDNLRIVNPAGDTNPAMVSVKAPYTLGNVAIEMQNGASAGPAIVGEKTSGALNHVSIGGAWKGNALIGIGATTIANSNISSNGSALILVPGNPGGHVDLIRNSTVQSSSTATNTNVLAPGVDLTIDSSLLLGGNPYDIEWVQTKSPTLASELTVAGSTLDAGTLGAGDALPVSDIFAATEGPAGIPARAQIEGSILLEQQTAVLAGVSDPLTVACSNSDVPSQSQAEKGTEGAIECASATNGNTSSTPASLFVSPGTNYNLNPGSSAIDSVPAGVISLPFGLTPSTTDLAGNPRVTDGSGDCVAVQDKGAFELQGHSAPCPVPPSPPAPKPVAGAITGLAISPSSFFAAPSGATIAKAKGKKKRKYGATIGYRDSQAATTTLTVLLETNGRRQGKSCKKPGRHNKHGRRCTILTALGSFVHADTVGANSLRFSGRLKGRKLARGSYRLQAVPHNAAGNGAAVSKAFTIRG
jgi:hypothetical protein